MRNKHISITANDTVSIIAIIYTAFLILSNLTASKVGSILGYNFTAVIFLFPFTYIIDDILTEVYGFKVSRRIIWTGLFGNLIVVFGSLIVVAIPSSPHWDHQKAFEIVFGTSVRILIASVSAYLFGEFINSIVLAKLKVKTRGRYFWLRALGSTIIGAIFDTSVFMYVAFYDVLPNDVILGMIGFEYCIKILVEVLVLPITIMVVKYLKAKDKIDHFDYDTKFNPFSLEVD